MSDATERDLRKALRLLKRWRHHESLAGWERFKQTDADTGIFFQTLNRQDLLGEPFVCTKATPWSPEQGTPVQHPDSECIYDGGWEQEYERYECRICGHVFEVTLAQ